MVASATGGFDVVLGLSLLRWSERGVQEPAEADIKNPNGLWANPSERSETYKKTKTYRTAEGLTNQPLQKIRRQAKDKDTNRLSRLLQRMVCQRSVR